MAETTETRHPREAALTIDGVRYLPESLTREFARFVLVMLWIVVALAFASGYALGHLM